MNVVSNKQSGSKITEMKGNKKSSSYNDLKLSIKAVKLIKELFKTTLGPYGMNKYIIDKTGTGFTTSDGLTICEKIPVQHPVIKLLFEAVKTYNTEVGDGAKSLVILTGELVERAENLLDLKIHPSVIIKGYQIACDKALQILNEIAVPIDINNTPILDKIAVTSMRSTGVGLSIEHFAQISIEGIRNMVEKKGGNHTIDIENIKIVKKAGKALSETVLVKGIIIEKKILHPSMPKRIENPKIAFLDYALDPYKNRLKAEIQTSPEQMKAFIDENKEIIKNWVQKIKASGANVLICQKTIAEETRFLLAKEGIIGVHEVKVRDLEKLAKATGGRIIHILDNLKTKYLGTATLIEERKVGEDKLIFVEGCKDLKSLSFLIRAGLKKNVDEGERALKTSLYALRNIILKNKIIAGGGSVEVELAKRIKEFARVIGGKEQLAINAFADSLDIIPRILTENAGLNFIDIITGLRSQHNNKEGLWFGFNALSKKSGNMMKEGVLQPVRIEEQILKYATEVASMIISINKIVMKPRERTRKEKQGQVLKKFVA